MSRRTPISYQTSARSVTRRRFDGNIRKTAAQNLAFVERAAKKEGVPCEAVQVTSDFPEDDILKVAKEKGCDLIVMATHGQSGLRGVLIGSVTQRVLAKATIPVMVLR